MEETIKSDLREFITMNYLFSDNSGMVADEDSLIESGVIDSTGILELIEFLEERYGIEVGESETVPDNLGSIDNLARFVVGKRGSTATEASLATADAV